MTNLLNVLKEMEQNTNGIKNDVISFIIENSDDSEDTQTLLEDINRYGCESGQIPHLIYYTDTVKYFKEHKKEIVDLFSEIYDINLNNLGVEEYNELSEIFGLDDYDTKMQDDEIHFKAMEIVADDNGLSLEELEKEYEEYEELIFDERYFLSTSLDTQAMNKLSWWAFEVVANDLYCELDGMELIG